MARPLRIEFAEASYHVMPRGNDRGAVVRDDGDRPRRCEWLAHRLRHRRAGHLFQGRFKGQLIDNEGYYWAISRYIHLNPKSGHAWCSARKNGRAAVTAAPPRVDAVALSTVSRGTPDAPSKPSTHGVHPQDHVDRW